MIHVTITFNAAEEHGLCGNGAHPVRLTFEHEADPESGLDWTQALTTALIDATTAATRGIRGVERGAETIR